ncbi:hypothetical protein RND81_04G089700 [Saponaria officinalis]|uniref:No apical meristem-associated C-terminal domain-containing protein n=1 Tax=Saponaria officinalis TaxID=3572 RepID=A0AAW1LK78_SAPOF
MWKRISELYEQSRVENKNKTQLSIRSIDAMKSRWKRLNTVVNKWVSCYGKVVNRPPASGTSVQDDIEEAQKLYRKISAEANFHDFYVYNTVMSRHPKWSLQNNNYGVNANVSDSSSKRSRSDLDTTPSSVNESTPTSVDSDEDINIRPEGREAAKKKRNGKAIVSDSIFTDDNKSLFDKHGTNMKMQIEQRQKRIDADLKIEELRLLGIEKNRELKILDTLLGKTNLSSREEELKEKLQSKYYS